MSDGIRISYDDYGLDGSGEPTLVILDTGIAFEETAENLQKLRLLFRAVVDRRVSRSSTCAIEFDIIKNTDKVLINMGPFLRYMLTADAEDNNFVMTIF